MSKEFFLSMVSIFQLCFELEKLKKRSREHTLMKRDFGSIAENFYEIYLADDRGQPTALDNTHYNAFQLARQWRRQAEGNPNGNTRKQFPLFVSFTFGVLTLFRLRYTNRFRNVFLLGIGFPDPCHATDDKPHLVKVWDRSVWIWIVLAPSTPYSPQHTHTHTFFCVVL